MPSGVYAYGAAPFPGSDRDRTVPVREPKLEPFKPGKPTPRTRNPQPTWEVAGHCPQCGAPIYSRRDPAKPEELPEVHYRCECRNKKKPAPKKKPAKRRRKKAPNRRVGGPKINLGES